MKYSDLKQRTFDQLFGGLALVDMLHRHELLEIAAGLREAAKEVDGDDWKLFRAVADAVEAYAMAEAQA